MKKADAELEWYRKQKVKRVKKPKVMRDAGSTPPEDLALVEANEAMDTWLQFQSSNRMYETEDGLQNSPPAIIPHGFTVDKSKHPDYRPGPVKVYTEAEIEVYEKGRKQ